MRQGCGDSQTVRRRGRHERTFDEWVDDGFTAGQKLLGARFEQERPVRGRRQDPARACRPVGSRLKVGRAELEVAAILTLEPERSTSYRDKADVR